MGYNDNVKKMDAKNGIATYYLAALPEEHAMRLLRMKEAGKIEIKNCTATPVFGPLMNIDSDEAFRNILWDNAPKIRAAGFCVTCNGLDIDLSIGYIDKTMTMKVDPNLSQEEKEILAEFYDALMYREAEELDEQNEEREAFRRKTITVLLCAWTCVTLYGIFFNSEGTVSHIGSFAYSVLTILLFVGIVWPKAIYCFYEFIKGRK